MNAKVPRKTSGPSPSSFSFHVDGIRIQDRVDCLEIFINFFHANSSVSLHENPREQARLVFRNAVKVHHVCKIIYILKIINILKTIIIIIIITVLIRVCCNGVVIIHAYRSPVGR